MTSESKSETPSWALELLTDELIRIEGIISDLDAGTLTVEQIIEKRGSNIQKAEVLNRS
ncbi:MAG: hypothetical protein GY853_16660 [PVC group bacterium]|nr:hypothetical protein [PVC group bacterium]